MGSEVPFFALRATQGRQGSEVQGFGVQRRLALKSGQFDRRRKQNGVNLQFSGSVLKSAGLIEKKLMNVEH